MSASMARPNSTAYSTAARFSTGSMPGIARSTALACVFGAAPKVVALPEKIFERVASCRCTSRPITISRVT
jgi:hypothetical protein